MECAPFWGNGCAPESAEAAALRAALSKIELAEGLVDQLLAGDAPQEEAEQLATIKGEIRLILKLLRERLQS